ncbi:hypothetical protein [Novosphingobium sp. CECT 9465]|uniref:hypothetical protein n=1 Tax=Novosphingobium sp. CECT 9465 TaxID=2829794 RepID=UPI001E38D146|nr:hypothetical protein [Novosphingobium sp. CECT 9465]
MTNFARQSAKVNASLTKPLRAEVHARVAISPPLDCHNAIKILFLCHFIATMRPTAISENG